MPYTYLMKNTCRHCGQRAQAQKAEWSGSTHRAMDSRGRMQTIRTKTVDAMPAYLVNAVHERYCDQNPNRLTEGV